MPFAFAQLELALNSRTPETRESRRQAAVAIIFREQRKRKEVLVIRRALNKRDPWSGQLAFPGGGREPADAHLLATAIRETREEIGVDLTEAKLLGGLDWIAAQPVRGELTIAPYVFAVPHPVTPVPQASEVAEVLWADVRELVEGTRDMRVPLRRDGVLMQLPAYEIGGSPLWGLSYAMLRSLLRQLGPAGSEPAAPTRP